MGAKDRWHGMKRGPKWSYYVYARIKMANPRVRNLGVTNCRQISGSSSWSQHSWGNAVDVGVPNLEYGDRVKRYVNKHPRFNVEHLLWRIPSHYDHLHLDWAPNYKGRPPCA